MFSKIMELTELTEVTFVSKLTECVKTGELVANRIWPC